MIYGGIVAMTFQENVFERLFASRVRVALIAYFVLHPGERLHVRALEKIVGAQYSAVWRELRNLEVAGLVASEKIAGSRFYELAPEFPLLAELRSMVLKTVGIGDAVRKSLVKLRGIDAAFIFGSFADGSADSSSDLDLMILGDLELENVSSAISDLESELNRPVNYVLYSLQEWRSRLDHEDAFATNVMAGTKLMLIGSEDGLRRSLSSESN